MKKWQYRAPGPLKATPIENTITSPSGHRSEDIFENLCRMFARNLADYAWKCIIQVRRFILTKFLAELLNLGRFFVILDFYDLGDLQFISFLTAFLVANMACGSLGKRSGTKFCFQGTSRRPRNHYSKPLSWRKGCDDDTTTTMTGDNNTETPEPSQPPPLRTQG